MTWDESTLLGHVGTGSVESITAFPQAEEFRPFPQYATLCVLLHPSATNLEETRRRKGVVVMVMVQQEKWWMRRGRLRTVRRIVRRGGAFWVVAALGAVISVSFPVHAYQEGAGHGSRVTPGVQRNQAQGGQEEASIPVYLPDHALAIKIKRQLGLSDGESLTSEKLASLRELVAVDTQIVSLEGLQYAKNLRRIDLSGNDIVDLSPLAALPHLEWLSLSFNQIADISPVATILSLRWIFLDGNHIADLSALGKLPNITAASFLDQKVSLPSLTLGWRETSLSFDNPLRDLSGAVLRPTGNSTVSFDAVAGRVTASDLSSRNYVAMSFKYEGKHPRNGIAVAFSGEVVQGFTRSYPIDPRSAIGVTWGKMGAEKSRLGVPLAAEKSLSSPNGAMQVFQNGRVYWSVQTGAHPVWGAIQGRWLGIGAQTSVLGFPVSAEFSGAEGGSGQHFQRGSIYWKKEIGAMPVRGAIRDSWKSFGWERGVLGYPLAGEFVAASVAGKPGAGQHFQGGSIYWFSGGSARAVTGDIRQIWANNGWERGYYGYPVSAQRNTSDGRVVQDFQGGRIVAQRR